MDLTLVGVNARFREFLSEYIRAFFKLKAIGFDWQFVKADNIPRCIDTHRGADKPLHDCAFFYLKKVRAKCGASNLYPMGFAAIVKCDNRTPRYAGR